MTEMKWPIEKQNLISNYLTSGRLSSTSWRKKNQWRKILRKKEPRSKTRRKSKSQTQRKMQKRKMQN
jgi:hypothetical protein